MVQSSIVRSGILLSFYFIVGTRRHDQATTRIAYRKMNPESGRKKETTITPIKVVTKIHVRYDFFHCPHAIEKSRIKNKPYSQWYELQRKETVKDSVSIALQEKQREKRKNDGFFIKKFKVVGEHEFSISQCYFTSQNDRSEMTPERSSIPFLRHCHFYMRDCFCVVA